MLRKLKSYFFGTGSNRALLLYQLGKFFYSKKYTRLGRYFFLKLERDYGVYISPKAEVLEGLILPHPTGIVIGEGVVIKENVTIYQQVTLGGARIGDGLKKRYPTIGENTVLFAGAKVLGAIKVGCNCIVGANAVVLKDVPDNHVAVGIPAKNKRR
jgi:serine O-acetyltransferase